MTIATAPHAVTEYGIAERVAGTPRLLPQAGPFYTDRYYARDLTGRAAAEAAAARLAERVPGTYEVIELRTFLRSHDAGLADALTDAELREWLRLRCAPADLDAFVDEFRGSTLAQMTARHEEIHCEGNGPGECPGHLDRAVDALVHCDGTCRH